jgi:HD superfamily phosphohydrolase
VSTRYRHCIGTAMTLAVMGYHFQVMTRKLSKAVDLAALPHATTNGLSTDNGKQAG